MKFSLFPVLCILVTAYFSYHGIWGNRGLSRLIEIRHQIEEAEQLALSTTDAKEKLKYKTEALKNPKTIDLDILEEEALRVLGQTNTNNLVIFD